MADLTATAPSRRHHARAEDRPGDDGPAPRALRGGLALVLALAVALLLLAQSSVGHRVLGAAGLSRQQPAYSTLSFADPSTLATVLGRSHELSLRFVVGSRRAAPRRFAWSATARDGGALYDLASGKVDVGAHGTATVARRIWVPCSGRRVAVHVTLGGTGESIDLWLACRRS